MFAGAFQLNIYAILSLGDLGLIPNPWLFLWLRQFLGVARSGPMMVGILEVDPVEVSVNGVKNQEKFIV